MHLLEILRPHSGGSRGHLVEFVESVTAVSGSRPLSDHLWLDLRSPTGTPLVVTVRDETGLLGLAQISDANDNGSLEVIVSPELDPGRAAHVHTDLVETVIDAYRDGGGGALSWWVDEPDDALHELAGRLDLAPGRALHEMRRALPTEQRATVETRSFEPGRDDDTWLGVNNRAFAAHGEQGGWTRETLASRLSESWFDPAGFRLHERDGRLAAFCWTKIHHDTNPVVGEIYVIAVDPEFHGIGLGKQLTLAGLDSIADRGIVLANLYVDADNAAAVGLYDRLGFRVHRTRQVFAGNQPATR